MILPGHIALGVLCHTYLDMDLPTALGAVLAPDLVDKTLSHVARCTPSSRYLMHNALAWGTTTAIMYAVGGSERAKAWAAGYLTHLLGDRGHVPWWWPFKRYAFEPLEDLEGFMAGLFGTSKGRRGLAFEMLLLAWALAMLCGKKRLERKR